MLDQTNISLREDFAARQMILDLLSYQKTISLSSIESERTFSVTGFYITKVRCSLEDQSINAIIALVFLKHILFSKKRNKKKMIG